MVVLNINSTLHYRFQKLTSQSRNWVWHPPLPEVFNQSFPSLKAFYNFMREEDMKIPDTGTF